MADEGLQRLAEHRRIWAAKPSLRRVYGVWFELLLARIEPGARVVEIGAGPGFLGEHARARRPDLRWTASDLLATGWNQVVADAARLPFAAATCDAVVAIDTLHHLPDPGGFFASAARVLRPGGRLVMAEPWVTPLSYPVYKWFHQEECLAAIDEWRPFAAQAGAKRAFDGNAAIPKSLVRRTAVRRWHELGFAAPRVALLNAFAHGLSLGFRDRSLLPLALVAPLLFADRMLAPLAPLTGLRALLCWDRLPAIPDKGAAQ